MAVLERMLNFMAAVCLIFDVNWDEDFEDDEYVKECLKDELVG